MSKGAGWPETRKRHGVPIPIVCYLVELRPILLYQDAVTLQRKWALFQAPESEGGLGLTPKEAGELISCNPTMFVRDIRSVRDKYAFLRARGVADITSCILLFPQILGLAEASIAGRMERLRDVGLDPADVLQRFPQAFGISGTEVGEKLRFILGVLRLRPSDLQTHPIFLNSSLDTLRHRIALLLELGLPLPPTSAEEGKKVEGGNLVTLLRFPDRLVKHLVKHGHPTIHTLADYKLAEKSPELLAAAMEWEAPLVAEAERLGLIPPPKLSADLS